MTSQWLLHPKLNDYRQTSNGVPGVLRGYVYSSNEVHAAPKAQPRSKIPRHAGVKTAYPRYC